jgi:hypothetical protein
VVTECDQLVVMPCVVKPFQVLKQSHMKCMGYEMLSFGACMPAESFVHVNLSMPVWLSNFEVVKC